jgi:hypothetical protein
MLKLTVDSLVVTSYEPAPAAESETVTPNTRGCPVLDTFSLNCPTNACTGNVNCTTGGGYAC